jgi:uncharacterized protein (DUF2126 family)
MIKTCGHILWVTCVHHRNHRSRRFACPATGKEVQVLRGHTASVEAVACAPDSRHIVTCNGRPLPLTATGVRGEFVAGLRYRAWSPPSALHPTIGVHTPLVIDVVDSWSGRAVGGCTYHVAHPGGRSYESFPVNANEAEGRRQARFVGFGHTPGSLPVRREGRNPEYPLTLDLRRAPEPLLEDAQLAGIDAAARQP